MNIINFIKFKSDRHYLLKHKDEYPMVKSKNKKKSYLIATFNKKVIQIFDAECLYTMNVDEFYDTFRIVRR